MPQAWAAGRGWSVRSEPDYPLPGDGRCHALRKLNRLINGAGRWRSSILQTYILHELAFSACAVLLTRLQHQR